MDYECAPTQIVPPTQDCAPTQLVDSDDDEVPVVKPVLEDDEDSDDDLPPPVTNEQPSPDDDQDMPPPPPVTNDDDDEQEEVVRPSPPADDDLFMESEDEFEEKSNAEDFKKNDDDEDLEAALGRTKKKKKKKKDKKKKKKKKTEDDAVDDAVEAFKSMVETEDAEPLNEVEEEKKAEEDAAARRAIEDELKKEQDALREAAAKRRALLAKKVEERFKSEKTSIEQRARDRLQALRKEAEESSSSSDSDIELEIVGGPKSKTTTTKKKKKALPVDPRKALRAQLQKRVRRQGVEMFAKQACQEDDVDADEYLRHLEAREAGRALKLDETTLQKLLLKTVAVVKEEEKKPDVVMDFCEPEVEDPMPESILDLGPAPFLEDSQPLDLGPAPFLEDSQPPDESAPLDLGEPPILEESQEEEPPPPPKDDDDDGNDADDEMDDKEEEKRDRAAKYRAMLEADAKKSKQKSHWAVEGEAEESDDEGDLQRGLGDFGFGVPEKKKDVEKAPDVVPDAEDLDAIVDELSDDEKGDDGAVDALNFELARKQDKAEMAAMLRGVREGFDNARGGGHMAIENLVKMDDAAKREAKRLGLDDGRDDLDDLIDGPDQPVRREAPSDDEENLAELISNEIKERHLGMLSNGRKRFLASESESSSDESDVPPAPEEGDDSDAEADREMALKAKAWARRAKLRRKQEKLEDPEIDPSDAKRRLLDADENSQFILGKLRRDESSSLAGPTEATDKRDVLENVSKGAKTDLLALSFFRTNSLLGSSSAAPIGKPKPQAARGASNRLGIFYDTSNSGFPEPPQQTNSSSNNNNNNNNNNKRKPTAPLRHVNPNTTKPAPALKKPKFLGGGATGASIWSHVGANRFG